MSSSKIMELYGFGIDIGLGNTAWHDNHCLVFVWVCQFRLGHGCAIGTPWWLAKRADIVASNCSLTCCCEMKNVELLLDQGSSCRR